MTVKRWKETTLRYRLMKFLRRREVIVSLAVLVQLTALMLGLLYFRQNYALVYAVSVLISILCAMREINSRSNPEMKMAWIVPMLLVPFFGCVIYILFGSSRMTRRSRRRIEHDEPQLRNAFAPEYAAQDEILASAEPRVARECCGLMRMGGYPAFVNTETEFLSDGTIMHESMLAELEKARRYIFLEYYIIEPGAFWDSILNVLERKAAEGVDVRLMYDDIGCISRLPADYPRQLRAKGIKVCVFNPFMPVLTSAANNRDHRKICVIDGVVAFTGGINLADEYINRVRLFGYWKDTGVMLRGDAAWGFAVMFLDMWNSIARAKENWESFRPAPEQLKGIRGQGWVQPLCTIPFSDMSLSESAIINIVRGATRYVYITTPYLIPTHNLIMALISAARSGVDVRIITPNIPDKRTIFAATRAHYMQLIEGGVKIYEYSPGFIHAKQVVADDRTAIVGSVNLDFRSLYQNFECAAWMQDVQCIPAIREDIEATIRVCERITLEKSRALVSSGLPVYRLSRSILRIFAPLM